MEPLTFESLNRNPELLAALEHQARRERAQAVYRLIVLPVRAALAGIRMRAPAGSVHVHRRSLQG